MRAVRSSSRRRKPARGISRRRLHRKGDRLRNAGDRIVGRVDRILEVADRQDGGRFRDARPGADEGGLQDASIRTPPRDDDVVRAARVGQLGDDGIEDRVRGDRSRQARQDAGERFGLFATADLELGHRLAMTDGGEADEEHEGGNDSIGRRRPDHEPEDLDQAEDEEGAGEDPPSASRATLRGLGRS